MIDMSSLIALNFFLLPNLSFTVPREIGRFPASSDDPGAIPRPALSRDDRDYNPRNWRDDCFYPDEEPARERM
jgi:hypothetical protein